MFAILPSGKGFSGSLMATTRTFRLRWLLLILLLAGVGFLIQWNRGRSIQVVRIAKVELQDIHSGVVTNGRAEPTEYREIRADVGGEITEVLPHDGDVVRSGQKLFAIRQPELASEMEHARAELTDALESLRVVKQGGT